MALKGRLLWVLILYIGFPLENPTSEFSLVVLDKTVAAITHLDYAQELK